MTQIAVFQLLTGLAALSIVILTLYSLSYPVQPGDMQNGILDSVVGIMPTEVLTVPPISQKELAPTHLRATVLNNAPHLKFDSKLCKNATMFGRPHQGGWFVCGDQMVEQFVSASVPLSASGSAGAEKCIVYSYGLGADWYVLHLEKNIQSMTHVI